MPDHLHAILFIEELQLITQETNRPSVGAHGRAHLHRPPRSLGSLIAGFKAASTKQINRLRNVRGESIWQRNYHDRIIRNQSELERIREYTSNNPLALRGQNFFDLV